MITPYLFEPYEDIPKTLAKQEQEVYPEYADYEVYIADQEYLQQIEELILLHEGDDLL